MIFDYNHFKSLSLTDLAIYFSRIEDSDVHLISREMADTLLKDIDSLDFEHAFYALCLAARHNGWRISDHVIAILKKQDITGGGQLSTLNLLSRASDFSESHLQELYKIAFRGPFGIFREKIDLLEQRLK